ALCAAAAPVRRPGAADGHALEAPPLHPGRRGPAALPGLSHCHPPPGKEPRTMNAPTTTTQPPAEVVKATQVANNAYSTATDLVVDSAAAYQAAGEDLVDLRARWKAIEQQRVHLKEPFLE